MTVIRFKTKGGFGSKINSVILTWVNRVCGAVIILYGLKLLYSPVQMFFAYKLITRNA